MKKYLLEIDGKKYEVEVDLSGSEPNVVVNGKKIDEFILWNPKEEGLSLEGTPDDPRFAYVKTKK